MTTISFYEARTHLSELLDQVSKGKKILITRRGKPAALLSPPPSKAEKSVKRVIDEFKDYSKQQGRSLAGIGVRELIEEGRRF